MYGQFPLRRYHLLSETLGSLTVHESGRIAWMVVPDEAYQGLEATPEDLEGFVDIPRSIVGVEVALLFRGTADGKTKVSLRSAGDADVNEIAGRFGGGGHVKAAGALLTGPSEAALASVVEAVEEALNTRAST